MAPATVHYHAVRGAKMLRSPALLEGAGHEILTKTGTEPLMAILGTRI